MARVAQIRTSAETALVAALMSFAREASPLAPLRQRALEVFTARGLPHRRVEAWHYTDLRNLMREAHPVAERAAPATLAEATRVVIEDGVCIAAPGKPPAGVSIRPLREALAKSDAAVLAALAPEADGEDAAVALNAGLARDGVVIEIAPGVEVATPLEIEFTTGQGAARAEFSRSLVLVGAGAKASIIETHRAAAPTQRSSALVMRLGEGATVEHLFVSAVAAPGHHVSTLIADVATRAQLRSFGFVAGGDLLRRQCFVTQSGEHAKIALRGISLLSGKQHADTTLVVDHAVPHGESRELFKHIISGEATGVFQGKVVVRHGAQKTDGGMKSQTLLMSDDAAVYNKPELEIFADDVACGHGATVGQLDANQLFYLMSRGIPKAQAEGMLIEAFAREVIDLVEDAPLRARCEDGLAGWLEARP